MKFVDRLMGRFLRDDLIDTAGWTDAVYRALEQGRLREQGDDTALDALATTESNHGNADFQQRF